MYIHVITNVHLNNKNFFFQFMINSIHCTVTCTIYDGTVMTVVNFVTLHVQCTCIVRVDQHKYRPGSMILLPSTPRIVQPENLEDGDLAAEDLKQAWPEEEDEYQEAENCASN